MKLLGLITGIILVFTINLSAQEKEETETVKTETTKSDNLTISKQQIAEVNQTIGQLRAINEQQALQIQMYQWKEKAEELFADNQVLRNFIIVLAKADTSGQIRAEAEKIGIKFEKPKENKSEGQ